MVNVGGVNIRIPGGGGKILSTLAAFGIGFVIFVVVAVIGYFIWRSFKNKTFYTNPVTLTFLYDNNTKKTKVGLKGGKFINRSGI